MRSMPASADKVGTMFHRRVSWLACAVLALSALLVPAGSAAGESRRPSPTSATSSGTRVVDPGVRRLESEISRIESDISRVLRASPGAVRTGPLEVSWDGGAVVSTWAPRSSDVYRTGTQRLDAGPSGQVAAATSVGGCPDGTYVHWFCFYENASFGGRMLQFRDCPSTQSLASYGFANQTTSWVNNRSGVTITVYDGSTSGTVLWREYGRSSDTNVGSWANDRADTFTCRT
jgi:hypothetical protein